MFQSKVERIKITKTMKDTIETKDLYLASLWYAKGLKMSGIRRDGMQCWFTFVDKSACEQMTSKYYSKEEMVIAKDYTDAIKTLKNLLFT